MLHKSGSPILFEKSVPRLMCCPRLNLICPVLNFMGNFKKKNFLSHQIAHGVANHLTSDIFYVIVDTARPA
jgi:hypothetical protein